MGCFVILFVLLASFYEAEAFAQSTMATDLPEHYFWDPSNVDWNHNSHPAAGKTNIYTGIVTKKSIPAWRL